MNKPVATLLALLAAPLMAAAAPVTNLLSNGSFEADAVSAGTWNISTTRSGWTTDSGGLELRNGVAGTAFEGSNFAELDTTANSSISQSLNTVIGQWYELSFEYSNRENRDVTTNGLAWSFGDSSGAASILDRNSSSDNLWQLYSTTVQATSTQTTLKIWATGTSDSYGSSLDAVSLTAVSAVPEPQSWALSLAGLLVMGWLARRRQPK